MEVSATSRELLLNAEEWSLIESVVRALHPAKDTTVALQSQPLTVGDCYGSWKNCVIETGKVDSPYARSVVDARKSREALLLQKHGFRAAILFDPSYNIPLPFDSKQQARVHLSKAWTNSVRLNRDANECRESPTSSLVGDD